MSVAAAILAGGKATRMGGRPKSFLEVDGRRIVDRQLEVLRPLFDELFIVANDAPRYAALGLPVVPDAIRDAGPLAGLVTAIEAAHAAAVVVVACDMPYLSAAALRRLIEAPADADVVVPRVAGRPEPLHARYARACAPAMRRRIAAGDLKIARVFEDVRVHWLEEPELRAIAPDLRFLANCNTPDDLEAPGSTDG